MRARPGAPGEGERWELWAGAHAVSIGNWCPPKAVPLWSSGVKKVPWISHWESGHRNEDSLGNEGTRAMVSGECCTHLGDVSVSLRLRGPVSEAQTDLGCQGDRIPCNLKTQGRGRDRLNSSPEPHPE